MTRVCYTIFCRKAGQCRACELCQVWKEAALSRIRHVSDNMIFTASDELAFFCVILELNKTFVIGFY